MRTERDPDLLLIEQMLAPPALEDAQRSLEYWRRRRKSLPLYRRAGRREAREMAALWEEKVREAELARFEASFVGRLLAHLGLSSLWVRRARFAEDAVLWLAWAVVMRKAWLVVRGPAVGLILVVVAVTALVLMFNQLA